MERTIESIDLTQDSDSDEPAESADHVDPSSKKQLPSTPSFLTNHHNLKFC